MDIFGKTMKFCDLLQNVEGRDHNRLDREVKCHRLAVLYPLV